MNPTLCITHTIPGKVELTPSELPAPRRSEVLIKTKHTAISPGTEIRLLSGKEAGLPQNAYVPGYQGFGVIEEAGPQATHSKGQMVFFSNTIDAFTGLTTLWGAHARHVLVDSANVIPLKVENPDPGFAMAKLAAVAYHGLAMAEVGEGDRVALIGLGLLGQLSMRIATLRGAEVVGFDRNPRRVKEALEGGFKAVKVEQDLKSSAEKEGVLGEGFDTLIDVTGRPGLSKEVMGLGRDFLPWEAPEGRPLKYLIQGSYGEDFSFDYPSAFLKEMRFFVPRDHTRKDLEAVIDLLSEGKLVFKDLAGDLMSPKEAAEAYASLQGGDPERLTVIFDWNRIE